MKSAPQSSVLLLSARQEAALLALIDALLPPLVVPPPSSPSLSSSTSSALPPLAPLAPATAAERRYWEHRLAADPAYVAAAQTAVLEKVSASDRGATLALLTALSTAWGTAALCGGVGRFAALAEWPVSARSELLRSLQYSRFRMRRRAFAGVKRLLCGLAFSYTTPTTHEAAGPQQPNPFWEAMGYPGSPVSWQLQVVDEQLVQQATQRQAPVAAAVKAMSRHLAATGDGGNNDNNNHNNDTAAVIDCDVVIVGAGAGGCVAARVLADAGYAVVVLERGSYRAPRDILLAEADALDRQYEQHGLLQTSAGTVMILAGAGLGGGTAINWSCCLPLPDYVREEWVQRHGLHAFGGAEYDEALRHILETIGASDATNTKHNAMNIHLQSGCDELQYQWETTKQVRYIFL